MRYLRIFGNCVLCGLLGGAFVTILVLQLNRHLPLEPWAVAALFARIAPFYAAHLTVFLYALLLCRELVWRPSSPPGWISARILAWTGTLVVSAAALLMWLNYTAYEMVLDDDAGRRLAAAAGATTLCAILLSVIAVVHYSTGRRGGRVGATLLALTLVASLLFPLAARGWGGPHPLVARSLDLTLPVVTDEQGPQVIVVAVDGASLDYVTLAVADGRLPNFGRLLEAGASMHLSTLRPTQPAPVWTTVATGKYPPKTGIRAAAAYAYAPHREPIELLPDHCFAHALVHLGMLAEVPYRSTAVRARPLWSILSSLHLPVGVVGWPVTDPAMPVRGFMVTDRFHLLASATPESSLYRGMVLGYPEPAVLRARAILGDGVQESRSIESPPIARDAIYSDVGAQLRDEYRPRLLALRYEGLDRAAHLYLRYATPHEFGDVSEEERRRHGAVLDRHYGFLDAEIGNLLATLREDDALFVVSGFGMEPVGMAKRMLARALGQPEVSGTHEDAPDGFMIAFGRPIRAGRARLGSLVDVAPTVLYFLGLPVARDMDGYARTDIFKSSFTAGRPITFIPSYER